MIVFLKEDVIVVEEFTEGRFIAVGPTPFRIDEIEIIPCRIAYNPIAHNLFTRYSLFVWKRDGI